MSYTEIKIELLSRILYVRFLHFNNYICFAMTDGVSPSTEGSTGTTLSCDINATEVRSH